MEKKVVLKFDWDEVVKCNAKEVTKSKLQFAIEEIEEELKDIKEGSKLYSRKLAELKELKEKLKRVEDDYTLWDWEAGGEFALDEWECFINEVDSIINGDLWLVDGSAGLWNGYRAYALQYVGSFRDFLKKASDGEILVEVYEVEKNGKKLNIVEVIISHHDGRNYYKLTDELFEITIN